MSLSVTKIGLVLGLLFFAHAMVPYSHAWPLVWSLVGGIAAIYLKSRQSAAQTFFKGLSASAKASFAAAAVFFYRPVRRYFSLASLLLSQSLGPWAMKEE